MTIESRAGKRIRPLRDAVRDAERLIKESDKNLLIQLAKSAIPGVGLVEGLSGEDLLIEGKKLTLKERGKALGGEGIGLAAPFAKKLIP